jgi:hypothetical protein
MPKFLEQALKNEYGANSDIPYKVMNAKGYMRGNKETPAGRALQIKHDRQITTGTAKNVARRKAMSMKAKGY